MGMFRKQMKSTGLYSLAWESYGVAKWGNYGVAKPAVGQICDSGSQWRQ